MLSSGNDIKEAILRQYDEVINIFENCGELPASLRETIEELREKLIEKRKEFLEEFCQVVVSGEISAGKSSLLNFLIGKDILPVSTFETKSIPCRLRYAPENRAKLVDDFGNVIEDINYDENESNVLIRLKKIIKGDELVPGLSYVEILFNECSLEGNVILVDTPGIKDKDGDDNSQLFTQLRKASALIYIIKTDSAGGTPKLFEIRNRVLELKQYGDSDLSPDCMLYVCNRWDTVDENEDVFEEIQSRLRSNGIEVREGQLLKLSIKKERENKKEGKPPSDQYKLFIEKLRGLMSLAVKDRYRRECQWLEKTLKEIISAVKNDQETLSKTLDEAQRLMTDYKECLESLEEAVATPKRVYCREVIDIYTSLSANLQKHLRTVQTCSEIIGKCKLEMEQKRTSLRSLKIGDLDNFAIQTFQQIINEEITQWWEKNKVECACAPVYKKILQNFCMLEKSVKEGLVRHFDKSGSESSSIHLSSAQVPVNRSGDNDPSRKFTEDAEKEDYLFSYPMGSGEVPVVANEAYNRPNNSEEEENQIHKNGSFAMSGAQYAQIPVIADEQESNGVENGGKDDSTLLITGSLRSAQVHVTDEELEMLSRKNGEGEDTQLFTRGEKVGLALTAPLWLPIAVTASVFVVPVSAFKMLSVKLSHQKVESNFLEVTNERHLAELLQELYKQEYFSEDRFNEEFEKKSIPLFNLWLDELYQESKQVIEDISVNHKQLGQNVELESKNKQSVERLLQELIERQEECCVISEKCCNLSK